jgi:hypothetical protein
LGAKQMGRLRWHTRAYDSDDVIAYEHSNCFP